MLDNQEGKAVAVRVRSDQLGIVAFAFILAPSRLRQEVLFEPSLAGQLSGSVRPCLKIREGLV